MLINNCGIDTIDGLLIAYLNTYRKDFSTTRLFKLIEDLNSYLGYRIGCLETVKYIANERATYLKNYLSGDMWLTEEEVKENIQPQIDIAQAIIDACNDI